MQTQKHADLLTVHTVKGEKQFTNCDYLFGDDAIRIIIPHMHCRLKFRYCDLTTERLTAISSDAIARLRDRKNNSWRD